MPRIFILVLSVAFAACCEPAQVGQGVSDAAPAKATRAARLDQIDDFRKHYEDSRHIEYWLKAAIGATAKAIRWSGGHCKLINKFNPLDAGTKWCGQATFEVFFDKPVHGKPGAPFGFRTVADTKDGPDYMRDTYFFEVNWKEIQLPGYKATANQDCD